MMSPLNDDDLNFLLEQAKGVSPQPSRELAARTLRGYQNAIVGRSPRLEYFLRPVSIPWPLGVLAAVLFILIGMVADHRFRRPFAGAINRTPEVSLNRPTAILRFKDFQPVSELKPHVVRSFRDDK